MNRRTIAQSRLPRRDRAPGFSLLESLVAILILSCGVLGIMGLQTNAITATHNADLRSEAGLLANELIGLLWSDRQNLGRYILNNDIAACTNGSNAAPASAPVALRNWISKVETLLPQAAQLAQTIAIDANRVVTVTVCWKDPQDTTPHRHEAVAQIQG